MKRLSRYLLIGMALALLAVLIVPVVAQDATPEPGKGGIIIDSNFGGDINGMNPLLNNDTASNQVIALLFPAFIGVDPSTALFAKDAPNAKALVKDWTISDDGKVYTFKLRDDWKWNDGTPITSADVLYSWDAAKSGEVNTVQVFLLDIIDKVEAPDANTVVVTFKNADCTALNNAGSLTVVPSHSLPKDFKALSDDPSNTKPTVTQGVFNFGDFRPGEQVSLTANQSYPGTLNGYVLPEGWVYKNVPDQTVQTEQFLAGEINVLNGPPVNRRADIRAAQDKGDATVYSFPGNSWDYISLNLADPNNPQNGVDKDGKVIDQGHHPLFGDVRVRQAMAKAINVDEIIQGAVFGEGTRMNGTMVPASWAYAKDLPPIAYDVDAAKKLLAEAGWVDDDNNPDTPLVAKGAQYAKDGTPFKFTLYTNQGNTRREAIGTIVQDQLKKVGIQVDFQAIDFNTQYDIMGSQTYDATIAGWRNGYPDDPDQTQLFGPSSDIIGSNGSNYPSYNNPELNDLMAKAKSLPGCDPTERAKIYAQIQQILQNDLPYIPMFAVNGMYAARSSVKGFSPYPSQLYWNVDTWYVQSQ